jgi:hypothetical protein
MSDEEIQPKIAYYNKNITALSREQKPSKAFPKHSPFGFFAAESPIVTAHPQPIA